MAATEISFFTERLATKEQELGEIKSEFHKYKLKQKVKYDNLKKEVYAFCRSAGKEVNEEENIALLQIKVAELETELEGAKKDSEGLKEELDKKQTQLNDHMILIKNLENRLKEMSPSREKTDKKGQNIDMEKIQQQMLYKDQRIIELNNSILDKERQILDLQEMCREQGEVADVKKKAMKIFQKKLMDSENRREVATETDPWFPVRQREPERTARSGGTSRSLSPGYAVASRAAGGSSPPPLDPMDQDPLLSRSFLDEEDILPGTSSGFHGKNLDEEVTLRKKQRKQVRFDLPPSATGSTANLAESDTVYQDLNETIHRLSEENSKLMADVDQKSLSLENVKKLLEESEQEISKLLKDTKNSSLKARAVAHSRIRELEETLAELNEEHLITMARFQTEIETLRSTREWEVEQNGLLRDQIDKLREKNNKLSAEVDSTGELNRDLESKVHETRSLLEGITTELEEAEELVVFMEDQKESILDDVEKMKEAIFAQDNFISLLEQDIVIYEEHVGLLRDSLGASKVDHRSLLRSKAFETKLKALEQEKEQISIRSREEKLKTKALAQKVKLLEEENEKLMERLCETEMGAAEDADMAETCRQLETRLRENEEKMDRDRIHFEIELQALQAENKYHLTACEELRFRNNVLERSGTEQEQHRHHVAALNDQQQTQLVQGVSQDTQELKNLVQEQEDQLRSLQSTITALEKELDNIRGINFELHDRSKEFDELEKDYDNLIEKHRETCVELTKTKETLTQLQEEAADVSVNEKLSERAKSAEDEILKMKKELEDARMTYNETAAVKKELETIKAELEREKTIGQQKWEDFCRKALESPSEPGSRKSSMEIQNQQYIIAFEDKITRLEEELQCATTQLAEAENERAKLEGKIKKTQLTSLQSSEINLPEELATRNRELEEEIEQQTKTEKQLLTRINDLELEASLAGELSVEMGRVIQQFEKQVKEQELEMTRAEERAHSAEMELRLHEMLNEELGSQLDDMREKEKSFESRIRVKDGEIVFFMEKVESLEASYDELREELSEKKNELDAERKKSSQLNQQIQDLQVQLTANIQEVSEIREDSVKRKEAQQAAVSQTSCNLQDPYYQQQYQQAQAQNEWNYSIQQTPAQPPARLQHQANQESHEHHHHTASQPCGHSHEPPRAQPSPRQQEDAKQPQDAHSHQIHASTEVEQFQLSSVEQIQSENEILRQCVNETIQLREDMSQDVEKLLQLKNELEIAVDSLKGEIWSLNGQLKASILDRENLEDRVVELDTTLAEEKRKVASLDVELSEQQELIEKATRQAAEAENESNRRLAECLEMESRRIELEQAYAQLTEYYNQLQTAYNLLYAQQQTGVDDEARQQSLNPACLEAIDSILKELDIPILTEDMKNKLSSIQQKIREKLQELKRVQEALDGQTRLASALEDRLLALEESSKLDGGEQLELKNKLEKLEGDLEWKQEECNSLSRQIDELQAALNAIIVNDGDDALATSRLRTELAILAAKLVTRQADVDSLFRTNAELAHTNVRLQNELDEIEEQQGSAGDQEALVVKVQELERKLAEWIDSKKEIEKLKTIEKILNNRILALEDQLLEKEEIIQDMEEQIQKPGEFQENEKVRTLDMANQAVIAELEELRTERDSLRATITTIEIDQKYLRENALRSQKEYEEEMKQYQEEVDEMKTEIERVRRLEENQIVQQQEIENLRKELRNAVQEKEEMKERNQELEEELCFKDNKEESWGNWDGDQTDDLKRQLETTQQELEKLKLRIMELDEEKKERREELFERLSREREELDALEEDSKLKNSEENPWEDWDRKNESSVLEELKQRNEELEDEIISLRRVLEDTSNTDELEDLKEKLSEKEREVASLQMGENDRLQQEVETLRTALDSLQQEQEELKTRNIDLEEELRDQVGLKTDLVEKERKIIELEELLESVQAEQKENWGEWEDKTQETDRLRLDLRSKDEELDQIRGRLGELEEKVEDYELIVEEAQSIREKLEKMEKELQGKEEDTRLQEEMNILKDEVIILRQKLQEKEPKISREQLWNDWTENELNAVEKLKKELEDNTKERSKMEAVILRVEKENEDLIGQLEEAGHVEKEMHRKVNDARSALVILQEEVQLLRNEKARLEVEISPHVRALSSNWEVSNDWEGDENESKQELEECQIKLANVTSTLQTAEETLQSTRYEAELRQIQLQQRIHSLEEEFKTSKDEIEQQKEKIEHLNRLVKRLEEMERQNGLLKESESRLLESVDEWGAMADKNKEEVHRLQKIINNLEGERQNLIEEIEYLKHQIQKAGLTYPEKDKILAELEALKRERDLLKQHLSDMEIKLSEIEKEKSQIKAAYESLKAKIQAKRTTAAASGSQISLREPSRASAVDEIRENPIDVLTHQVAEPVKIISQQEFSQGAHERTQQFIDKTKDFLLQINAISDKNRDAVGKSEALLARHTANVMHLAQEKKPKMFYQTEQKSDQLKQEKGLADQCTRDHKDKNISDLKQILQETKDQLAIERKRIGELETTASDQNNKLRIMEQLQQELDNIKTQKEEEISKMKREVNQRFTQMSLTEEVNLRNINNLEKDLREKTIQVLSLLEKIKTIEGLNEIASPSRDIPLLEIIGKGNSRMVINQQNPSETETLNTETNTATTTQEKGIQMLQLNALKTEKPSVAPVEARIDIDAAVSGELIATPLLEDVIERNTHFIRAGIPITHPIIRRLRLNWGHRGFRPYMRYGLAVYFMIIHLLFFNCWMHK